MSYAALGRLERPWKRDETPEIRKKWAKAAPQAVGMGVGALTGSHHAGHAASLGTSVAMEKYPKLKEGAGELVRDAAYETGTTLLAALFAPVLIVGIPVVLIHDALVEPKNKWLK